jgi:hypothetical protein
MVKSALILVPSPLVTQWGDELATKFQLRFYPRRIVISAPGEMSYWNHENVLASINVAKSKKFSSLAKGNGIW